MSKITICATCARLELKPDKYGNPPKEGYCYANPPTPGFSYPKVRANAKTCRHYIERTKE